MRKSLAFLLITLAGCGADFDASDPQSLVPGQHQPHVMPSSTQPVIQNLSTVGPGCNANAHLSTQGGGSIQASSIALTEIDWGSGLSPETRGLAQKLYMTLDETLVRTNTQPPYVPYSSWIRAEYGTAPLRTGATYQITPANTSTTLNDGNIQAELQRQVNLGTITADNQHLYMVHLPPGITVTTAGGTSCVQWCAYHNFTTVNGNKLFYAVVPDFKSSGCRTNCFENTSFPWQSRQQAAESHEIIETLTDGDFTGWQDNGQPTACGNEIGDICNAMAANITSWDDWDTTVTVQMEWSNQANDCVTGDRTPAITSISPSTGPRSGGQTVTISGARFVPGGTTFKFGTAFTAQASCSATSCTVITPPANTVVSPFVSVPVIATANGIDSSWDGTQDNFGYTCSPKTCQPGQCGKSPDGCGGTLICGCSANQVCTGAQTCCTPLSPAQACANVTCGTTGDGCGGQISCGPACPCVPKTCNDLGLECGPASDGCGGTLSCGGCLGRMVCNQGVCGPVGGRCPTGLVNCDGACVKPNFCW